MKSFRKQFLSIFAISLVATLLLCPGNYSVPGGIRDNICLVDVQAEEPTITDTQKGVALLMTILFAQGLRFVGDWHNVVEPGIEKLWNDFTEATGNAVTLPMIVAGSSLALGYIRTSNTVNNAIANFTAWYKTTFSQPTTGETTVPVVSGGASSYFAPTAPFILFQGQNYGCYTSSENVRFCGIHIGEKYYVYAVSLLASQSFYSDLNNGAGYALRNITSTGSYQNNSFYYLQVTNRSGTPNFEYTERDSNTFSTNQQQAYYYTWGAGVASLPDISMTGESLELRDGYQLDQEQAKLYDISALTAMVAELALTLDNIEDLVRDIPLIYDTPWSLDYPDDPSYVDTPDDTIPWVTVPDSVIPADTPEYVPTTPGQTDSYKILGLERVFPFSIPFDLYYLTQIFVATPETPHFTYAIMNPATNQLLTQEFDLHWFDTLAAVIRTGETVAFLIFLIFVTRGLIRS